MVIVPDGPSSLHLVVLHQVLHVKVFVAAQHAPAKKTFGHFNTCYKTNNLNSNSILDMDYHIRRKNFVNVDNFILNIMLNSTVVTYFRKLSLKFNLHLRFCRLFKNYDNSFIFSLPAVRSTDQK